MKYHRSSGRIYGITSIYSFGAFFFGYGQSVTNIVQNNCLYNYGYYWEPATYNEPITPTKGSDVNVCNSLAPKNCDPDFPDDPAKCGC